MLKHLITQSLVAICDECPTVSRLHEVKTEDGKLSYCCSRCADKIAKGFLFGIEPQKAVQHAYED